MKSIKTSFLSVHPHKGYQNTSFVIYSNYDNARIKIIPGDEYVDFEGNISVRREFLPGKYTLCAVDESGIVLQEDTFFVNNAIKKGGGIIKKEIVLKSWVVIMMSDRTYFYNRLDKRDFFEFEIHDSIAEVTSDILLFDNSVFFSMSRTAVIVKCKKENIIYYNDKILVYKEDDRIFFFNYERCIQVLSGITKYVYDNVHQKLFVYQPSENRVRIVDLTDKSYEGELYKVLFVPKEFEFLGDGHCIVQDEHDDFYLCNVLNDNLQKIPFDSIKAYFKLGENAQFSFSNNDKRFDISTKNEKYKISVVNTTPLTFEIEKKFLCNEKYEYNYFLLLNGDEFIQTVDKQLYNTNDCVVYGKTFGDIATIYNKRDNTIRNVNNICIQKYKNNYGFMFRNGIVLKKECQSKKEYQSKKSCYNQLCDGEFKPLCESITYVRNSVFKDEEDSYYYVVKGEIRQLPEKLFNLSKSSDVNAVINTIKTGIDEGDCLLIKSIENKWLVLEWDGEKYISREVFLDFENDYYKEVLFTTNKNELFCRMKDDTFCLYNSKTNRMQKLPDIKSPASFIVNAYSMVAEYDSEKEQIVFKDPVTLMDIPQVYMEECRAGYGGTVRCYPSLDGRYLASVDREAKSNRSYSNLLEPSFKLIDKSSEKTIYIKGNCTFRISYINNIAFSPDSRYMAVAGATSSTGYFMLYDIKEEKIIGELYPKKENEGENVGEMLSWGDYKSLWGSAIWIAMFNKDNDVALYTSIPNTCFFSSKENYERAEIISKRSLLCFSPSGQYCALSNKRYIPYCYQLSTWGHQNSMEVYIRRKDKSGKEMGPFCDLQKWGDKNIGIAAFSLDERQLLMISDDGCFVMRNLDIENDEEWHDESQECKDNAK